MKAFLFNIGDELTKGEICNTNASYIAKKLTDLGIIVDSIITLPDNLEISRKVIKKNIYEKGIYIFTGGIGGTKDDITRKIIKESFDVPMVVSISGEKALKRWYEQKNREFTDADRSQAMYPKGGRILKNNVGLAYGFYLNKEGKHIFSLPGVPSEMKDMFENEVIPIIKQENLFASGYAVEYLTFANIAEYTLDREINKIISSYPGIQYGTRSNNGIIRVRIDSYTSNPEKCIDEISRKLKNYLIFIGKFSLEEFVGKLLSEKKLTISFAESCTGGYLSKITTDVPGSSKYFIGGVVSYSNKIKSNYLNVKSSTLKIYGAVSSQTAEEMALGVRNKFNSDIAISTTGIAGPTGGSKEKPVGTVYIGWAVKNGNYGSFKNHFPGDRETVRIRTVNRALIHLIRMIREYK